ncbi:ribosome hibernation-promoting factor, HPF/YfiA family [Mucisphaera calidilacus]|uniref:Ribosome hibernation promoting factor n=1 Tax=Mucisphaera calidilacus TaxID=2527982 RepID=A0A518BW19_9BACT|nr:ribosome-associated translation inhibitor RaiA [Mucisphaera calidilacus]QDU71168.1 Ribosome hibernation promoting factor [Mucisphaera calidilacus]
MDIIVTGKHLDVTEPIRDYAEQRLEKITRYYDRASKAEVILGKEESTGYAVEIIVHVDHHEHFVAEDDGDDLYKCIDLATDKAARQVHDYKEKVRSHKG